MKQLCLLPIMLLLSFASFAQGPVLGTAVLCAGSTSTLSDATTGGTWSSGSTTVATVGSSTGIVTGMASGTSTITYTTGSGSVMRVVTVNTAPAFILGPVRVCVPDSISLINTVTGGTWSSDNTAIATVGSSSGVVTGISADAVAISYTLSDGCSAGHIVTVLPMPAAIMGATTVCSDRPLTLSDTNPGDTAFGGAWSTDASSVIHIINVTGDTVNMIGLSAGTALITYISHVSCSTTVMVVVNPTPMLTSPLTTSSICNSTLFTYIPVTSTPGTTFLWERPFVPGISGLPAAGTDTASETLVNTTYLPLVVTYVYTLTAGACTNPENVTVTINPTPTLSGSTMLPAICDTVFFDYFPVSATPGTTYAWSRAAVTGISNPAAEGTDNPHELLTNTTGAPITVVYTYTLTANGCTHAEVVTGIIDPCGPLAVNNIAAITGGITIFPNPATTQLTIRSPRPVNEFTISDLFGRIISRGLSKGEEVLSVDVSGWPAGAYFVKVNGAVQQFFKE